MNILYKSAGVDGGCLLGAVVLFICSFAIIGIMLYEANHGNPKALWFSGVSLLLAILGAILIGKMDRTVVKATVDNTVPWVEVNEKYQLISQEGDIYTFLVKGESDELVQKEEK